MKLKLALDEKQFDVRMLDRLLREGKVTQEEYDKFINSLEDCSDLIKKESE